MITAIQTRTCHDNNILSQLHRTEKYLLTAQLFE